MVEGPNGQSTRNIARFSVLPTQISGGKVSFPKGWEERDIMYFQHLIRSARVRQRSLPCGRGADGQARGFRRPIASRSPSDRRHGGTTVCKYFFIFLFSCFARGTAVAQPAAPSTKQIIPWIEINLPDKLLADVYPSLVGDRPPIRMKDYAIEVMTVWAESADTMVVSTRPGKVDALYPFLMAHKPHDLRLIGGLKTYLFPGVTPDDKRPYDFTEREGWRRIAEESRRIAELTGVSIVVLENETALKPYHERGAKIDYAKLIQSLEPLRETGIQFWWNLPRILEDSGHFPDAREQTTRFVQAIITALPDSVFLGGYTAWADWRTHRSDEVGRRKQMLDLVGPQRMQERLFVTQDGRWHVSPTETKRRPCYLPAEAVKAMEEIPSEVFNLYPDADSMLSVACEFARLRPRNR
jgi:hypothetical protein